MRTISRLSGNGLQAPKRSRMCVRSWETERRRQNEAGDQISRVQLPVPLPPFSKCRPDAERDALLHEKREKRKAVFEKGPQAQAAGMVSASAYSSGLPDLWL